MQISPNLSPNSWDFTFFYTLEPLLKLLKHSILEGRFSPPKQSRNFPLKTAGAPFGFYLEPQTAIYNWMFGETTIFYIKIWSHPNETSI